MSSTVVRTLPFRALLPKLFLLALAFAWFAPSYLAPTWQAGTDEQVARWAARHTRWLRT